MALEMRFVEGNILDPDRRFRSVDIAHLVDQKKRITMGDNPLDQLDIGAGLVGHWAILSCRS